MPRAWNLFRYAQIKKELKAATRQAVSGNAWHILYMRTYRYTYILTDLGWNEYVIRFGNLLPTRDMIYSLSLLLPSVSHSVCFSAYLLTKELSLCLSWRIILNGDFLCNHLIIHQFSKKPQRGSMSILSWRTQQWERRGRGGRRVSRWKWSKWILASLPAIDICI